MKGLKKVAIALVLILGLGVALLAGISSSGGLGGLFAKLFGVSSEYAELEALAKQFLTDLQYKDFAKSAQYHTLAEQAKVDIPRLIENVFQVKPEFLNIRDFKVTKVTVDPDGRRARTFFRSTLELLNTAEGDKPNKEKQVEGILYWHKRPASEAASKVGPDGKPLPPSTETSTAAQPVDGPAAVAERWFMKLESSLH